MFGFPAFVCSSVSFFGSPPSLAFFAFWLFRLAFLLSPHLGRAFCQGDFFGGVFSDGLFFLPGFSVWRLRFSRFHFSGQCLGMGSFSPVRLISLVFFFFLVVAIWSQSCHNVGRFFWQGSVSQQALKPLPRKHFSSL